MHYDFELEAPALNVFNRFQSAPLQGNRQAYVRQLYQGIEELAMRAAHNPVVFFEALRSWGGHLSDQLLPKELGLILYNNRSKIKNIQVVSTEPFIPWELLLIKDLGKSGLGKEALFLAEMGLIRWLHGWSPTQTLEVRRGKARYVVPRYRIRERQLEEAQKEALFLQKELGATAIQPEPEAILKILGKKNSFDLLHFACHGEASARRIMQASLLLEEREVEGKLRPTYLPQVSIEQSADFTDQNGMRPMVVLNACQTGRQGIVLTQMGGFAQAFLRHGAGAFVGALWSIGDVTARVFVESFYRSLKKGKNLSQAALEARAKAKNKNPLDATWLAYVVYGDPYAKLELEEP